MTVNRFDQLIDEWTPKLKAAFLNAVEVLRGGVDIGLVARLLEKGDVDGALRAVGLDPLAFRSLDATIVQAFEAGGNYTANALPVLRQVEGHKLQILFDIRNPRAEQWLKSHSSTLITEILDDQREAVRSHLVAGMEAGSNPRTVALDIAGRVSPVTGKREGSIVGLTTSQERWVQNYAKELLNGDKAALSRKLRDKRFDKSVIKNIDQGHPIPADLRQKMIAAYRNRALKYRADAIARTEAMASLHQSQTEAMQQGIDRGQVEVENVIKIWHSASDRRVRDTHNAMDGLKVGFKDYFTSPSGARLRFPGDPQAPASEIVNCRCWVEQKVKFLKGVK